MIAACSRQTKQKDEFSHLVIRPVYRQVLVGRQPQVGTGAVTGLGNYECDWR